MALHHKLCHVLGGSFNLPHAETHSIVLPHAMRYNYDGAREAMARVERLGSAVCAGGGLTTSKNLGLPMRLSELGLKETTSSARRASPPKRLIRTLGKSSTRRCWSCCGTLTRVIAPS